MYKLNQFKELTTNEQEYIKAVLLAEHVGFASKYKKFNLIELLELKPHLINIAGNITDNLKDWFKQWGE